MGASFSLEYYDRIFGVRSPAFFELLQALVEELEDYGASFGPTLASGDPEALTRLRHTHQPLVENLKLATLAALEEEARSVSVLDLPDLQTRFSREARRLADLLILELLPAVPDPQ
jgi:hypothetical protein